MLSLQACLSHISYLLDGIKKVTAEQGQVKYDRELAQQRRKELERRSSETTAATKFGLNASI